MKKMLAFFTGQFALADSLRKAEQEEKDILLKMKARIGELENEVKLLTPTPPVREAFAVGDRVKGNSRCRFNQAMHGVVKYIEPSGRLWVLRDGADSDCYYFEKELDKE